MICSFERSLDDEPPRIRMRVHKIIRDYVPVDPNYDGYVPKPIEGDLVRGPNRPWMSQMDRLSQLSDLQFD
jgi:hypothetical protein